MGVAVDCGEQTPEIINLHFLSTLLLIPALPVPDTDTAVITAREEPRMQSGEEKTSHIV